MHIKADDIVEVISGEDRGRARVLRVLRDQGKVIVEGVNRVYRHIRKGPKNLQGGRLSKEMPIDISNVQLVCNGCGKAARFGSRVRADGAKERFCKKCGAAGGVIMPSRATRSGK